MSCIVGYGCLTSSPIHRLAALPLLRAARAMGARGPSECIRRLVRASRVADSGRDLAMVSQTCTAFCHCWPCSQAERTDWKIHLKNKGGGGAEGDLVFIRT